VRCAGESGRCERGICITAPMPAWDTNCSPMSYPCARPITPSYMTFGTPTRPGGRLAAQRQPWASSQPCADSGAQTVQPRTCPLARPTNSHDNQPGPVRSRTRRPAGADPLAIAAPGRRPPGPWADLRDWVDHLVDRFGLETRVIPPCWYRHNTVVEALSALRDHQGSGHS
jgi:hypothetical protein